MLTLDKVYQASHTLKDVARRTDLIKSSKLAKGFSLYLKTENLQVTGSFKVRGAYYKMSKLSNEDKEKEVIACSAGNHAQGVALSAQKAGVKAKIFIPSIAPISKVEATRNLGATVELIDGVYDDAYKAAMKYQEEHNCQFIHPFNDEDVIAGQGTVALEILDQIKDLDAVVVPIGGGGLISGVAFTIKMLNPSCKVYGVQAKEAASMFNSFKNSQIERLDAVSTFADGIAVKEPGNLTFELCSQYVDDIVTVTEDEIATAILLLMEEEKLVAEGAGATAVAAVLFDKLPLEGKKVCAIISGGNIDVNILSKVISRGLLTTGRYSDLVLSLLDKPGSLKEVSSIIADTGANVTGLRYNAGGENTAITACNLHISLETRSRQHLDEIKAKLRLAGYTIVEN